MRWDCVENALGIRPYVLLASEATQKLTANRLARWGLIERRTDPRESDKLRDVIDVLRHHAINFEVINPYTGRRWMQREWI